MKGSRIVSVGLLLLIMGYGVLGWKRAQNVRENRKQQQRKIEQLLSLGQLVGKDLSALDGSHLHRLTTECKGSIESREPSSVLLYVALHHPSAQPYLVRLVALAERLSGKKFEGDAASKIKLIYPEKELQSYTVYGSKSLKLPPEESGIKTFLAMLFSPLNWKNSGNRKDAPNAFSLSSVRYLIVPSARAHPDSDRMAMQTAIFDRSQGRIVCRGLSPLILPDSYRSYGVGKTREDAKKDAAESMWKLVGLMSAINGSFSDSVMKEICEQISPSLCNAIPK